jgi:hypothetical protein
VKNIEQVSFGLLAFSLVLLLLLAGGFALQWYTSHPPLFTPPPESRNFSYVERMRDATSVEGLRQVCTFWAEREDQSQRFVNALHEQFLSTMRQVVTWLAVLGVVFAAAGAYIYLAARRIRLASPNAL